MTHELYSANELKYLSEKLGEINQLGKKTSRYQTVGSFGQLQQAGDQPQNNTTYALQCTTLQREMIHS